MHPVVLCVNMEHNIIWQPKSGISNNDRSHYHSFYSAFHVVVVSTCYLGLIG
jgi:hypothetical protein